jgi:hypothetical protein
MKKIKILLPLIVIAALLLTVIPASAESIRTPVNAIEYVCLNTPGDAWMDGNVYHVRGQVNETVVVANGQVWGINTASIDFNYNLKTGQIVVAVAKADFVPLGADGGYTGTGFFRFFGSGSNPVIGVGVFQGYGALKGQSIHLADMMPLGPTDPAGATYCEGHGQYFDTTLWKGYILTPGG